MMSYLTPKVDCSNVTNPDTKNMVPITSLLLTRSSPKHIRFVTIRGMDTVLPNMVR